MRLDVGSFEGLDRAEVVAKLRRTADHLSLAERFTLLHRLGIYYHEESLSGPGSSLAQTRALRAALPGLLRRYRIRRLLDLPCGDFAWMQKVDLAGIEYVGADIVPEIVARNRHHHDAPGRSFAVIDATRDPLPEADLILCRDLLIHLSLADIASTLANFRCSGAELLLLSHYRRLRRNRDIESGDFREVNLTRPPFSLPRPLEVIHETSWLGRRTLGLWRAADLGPIGGSSP